MTARLDKRFADLKQRNRAAFIAYIMANDPDHETCFDILRQLPTAGADVIELGFPFSDPMADGPSVQKAGQRALKAGGSLRKTLDLVTRFRAHDKDTPLILMGYTNPVEQMGHTAFAEEAHKAGVDGCIIVDLPPEEDAPLRAALSPHQISLIRLAAPTTNDERLKTVLEGVSGFLYYVSVVGVTGAKAAVTTQVRTALEHLKQATSLPIAVGFGVRAPEAARALALTADAVVVGSAIVDEIANSGKPEAVERVLRKVKLLSDAVHTARDLEGLSP
ncbi:MAG: tryptophan synthase subunit alpha [Proteobacteria bacterium]|nr:tryptophan synthase subunit alpha [Pseudomonadota bacterium]